MQYVYETILFVPYYTVQAAAKPSPRPAMPRQRPASPGHGHPAQAVASSPPIHVF